MQQQNENGAVGVGGIERERTGVGVHGSCNDHPACC